MHKTSAVKEGTSVLKIIKAKWILPISSEPIKDACVVIAGNTIKNIVLENQLENLIDFHQYEIEDYGEAIILPGFINLHTHLEHTSLRGLAQKSTFLAWLAKLMNATAQWSVKERTESAESGVNESISKGTTLVVDISYNGASVVPLAQSGLRSIVGLEIFGINESAADQQWAEWLERYNNLVRDPVVKTAREEELLTLTVSPHAPYTVSPALWSKAMAWSKEERLPLLAHLAESKAEADWFETNDEDLKNFLIFAFSKKVTDFAQLYEAHTDWKSKNSSPIEHLYKYGLLTDNLLAAHGVQLSDRDIDLLKEHKVSIAHCPNSNIILQCGRAPLAKLLKNYIRVGLGTDSAASSNNLDLLAESLFAINLHGDIENNSLNAKEAVTLITLKAAECLGLENKLGSLQAGKLADIAIFKLPQEQKLSDANDPEKLYDLLVQGLCKLESLIVNGKAIFAADKVKMRPLSAQWH